MADKLDYKKEYKDLYLPKQKPMLIEVPPMPFFMVDGVGAPGSEEYQEAISILYSLSFTIKMSKMSGTAPPGYFEYVVPPLEGLWWGENGPFTLDTPRERWHWTSMIRQPDFVTEEVYQMALFSCAEKKPEVPVTKSRFATFAEGLCVQILHVGPYLEERRSLEQLLAFCAEHDLTVLHDDTHKHHEIYLSDPRRVAPDKLKTVLRLPVKRK